MATAQMPQTVLISLEVPHNHKHTLCFSLVCVLYCVLDLMSHDRSVNKSINLYIRPYHSDLAGKDGP